MLVALFLKNNDFYQLKLFNIFLYIYNIGLILMTSTMLLRGIIQVINFKLTSKFEAMLSGFAGLGHIVIAIGIIIIIKKLDNRHHFH